MNIVIRFKTDAEILIEMRNFYPNVASFVSEPDGSFTITATVDLSEIEVLDLMEIVNRRFKTVVS